VLLRPLGYIELPIQDDWWFWSRGEDTVIADEVLRVIPLRETASRTDAGVSVVINQNLVASGGICSAGLEGSLDKCTTRENALTLYLHDKQSGSFDSAPFSNV
jgi:hypothetical protein